MTIKDTLSNKTVKWHKLSTNNEWKVLNFWQKLSTNNELRCLDIYTTGFVLLLSSGRSFLEENNYFKKKLKSFNSEVIISVALSEIKLTEFTKWIRILGNV